jgi:uncharacterized membrane protein YphA (DoxX/SURF4 family)
LKVRTTLATSRRYYPGVLAALFLVLLRMAIGWHFFYEGIEKIYSMPEGRNSFLARILPPPPEPPPLDKTKGTPAFSAEGYLRNATGPLAPYFRQLVPDPESREKLQFDRLKAHWRADLDRFAGHYHFNDEQKAKAEQVLQDQVAVAQQWFGDLDTARKIDDYFHAAEVFQKVESDPGAIAALRAEAYRDKAQMEATRSELVRTIDGWTQALRGAWQQIATPDQLADYGPLPKVWTPLDWINALTMYGLTAMGLCLILGLFTRLAALGGAVFLAMIYLSMPPWPGLPPSPMAEGHYLFVSKNLIEMIACLALVFLPTGQWAGLDALLFGWMGRRRRAADEPGVLAAAEPNHPRGPIKLRT